MNEKASKILFVDDQLETIEALMDFAQSLGFDAHGVADPEEAIQYISVHYSSLLLIVSDWDLGATTGLQFRDQIMPRFRDIPFIIYSGFIDQKMLKSGLTHQVSAFVDKPYDFDEFENFLKEGLKDRIQLLEERRILSLTFIEEATDLIEELEKRILEIETHPEDYDAFNSVFRIVHTIKGGSGVLDWPEFTKFLHLFEDLLSKIKNEQPSIDSEITSKLFAGTDFLIQVIAGLKKAQRSVIALDDWRNLLDIQVAASPSKQEKGTKAPAQQSRATEDVEDFIKVPNKILDDFMELSGEITVIRNTINKLVRSLQRELKNNRDLSLLTEYIEEMHKINSSMQTKIMDLRKISLQNVMRNFPRTVRDLSLSLKKEIEFRVVDDGLRIDTKLATILRNSLIHLIRNSADHGIELPEDRKKAGKPGKGTITLSALETGDEITIHIQDDGRGINTEAVGKRAIEKGLYSTFEIEKMNEKQLYRLIFEPGFSTAAEITDISGRGVGLDMVKSSIESVRGRIEIDSQRGKGTRFSLKMPIPKSVLIIHSLRVRAGSQPFNIPQETIVRLVKIDPGRRLEMIKRIDQSDVLDLAGQLYQIIHLSQVMQGKPAFSCDEDGELNIVLVQCEGLVYGILVDAVEDAEEIVVKKLAPQIGSTLFLGSTFLGDGTVGLIIDTLGLAKHLQIISGQETLDQKAQQQATEAEIEFLVVRLQPKLCCGIPLETVFRLEELDPKQFTLIGRQLTVIYRDRIIPLVSPAMELGVAKTSEHLEWDKVPTVICCFDGRYYGLLVYAIEEILKTSEPMDTQLQLGAFLLGNVVIQQRILSILDVRALLKLGPPPPALILEAEVKPNEADEDKLVSLSAAEGWGIF